MKTNPVLDEVFGVKSLPNASLYLKQAILDAGRIDGLKLDSLPTDLAAVIGAGVMGRGIALVLAKSGRQVTMIDRSPDALAQAKAGISGILARDVVKGRQTESEINEVEKRLSYSTAMVDIAGAQIVIESVYEDLATKQAVISEIGNYVRPNTIIATNTSTLDIDLIAGASNRPDFVIGTHFFLPAHITSLLEIVPGKHTQAQIIQTVFSLATELGKSPFLAGNCDGFVGNRLFDRFHQEAMYLVEEGAFPSEVDTALEAWGMAIGPFRTLDMINNAIPWKVRQARILAAPTKMQPRVGDALCEAKLWGMQAGKGWYRYQAHSRRGKPYAQVETLIKDVSQELGLTRRLFTPPEIVSRCVLALIHEAMLILDQGYARRASDIDMAYVLGYGFPAAIGGPLKLALYLGFDTVKNLFADFEHKSARHKGRWQLPSTIGSGQNFSFVESM